MKWLLGQISFVVLCLNYVIDFIVETCNQNFYFGLSFVVDMLKTWNVVELTALILYSMWIVTICE